MALFFPVESNCVTLIGMTVQHTSGGQRNSRPITLYCNNIWAYVMLTRVLGFHSCSATQPRNLDKTPKTLWMSWGRTKTCCKHPRLRRTGNIVIRIPLLTLTSPSFPYVPSTPDCGRVKCYTVHPMAFLATFRWLAEHGQIPG
jgi:hypothetical protein